MRRLGLVILVIAFAAATYQAANHRLRAKSRADEARRPLYYVDPMHPAYKSDKPGTAPDCGMPLVPVYAGDVAMPAAAAFPAGAVTIDGATRRLMGIRVVAASHRGITHLVQVVGRVAADDTRVYRINSGVDGIIRETYNDSIGVVVKSGQKLATYYAPDFLALSSGFLAVSERVPGTGSGDGNRTIPFPGALSKQGQGSIQAYRDRLRNLGMSDIQIDRMAETHQLQENIDIVSPVDGVVMARNVSPGQHFEHTTEFYRIADLTRVWILAEVSERDVPYLRAGDQVQIVPPGQQWRYTAYVTDSLPQSEATGGTVKLRLEAANPQLLLRPEMLVDVDLHIQLPAATTVPADALLDLGDRSRVYVESADGVYAPREVETGWRSDGQVEIRRGLRPDERVVAGAMFLVDSESRLHSPAPVYPGNRAMAAGAPRTAPGVVKDPNCGMQVDAERATASGMLLTDRGVTYYFCSRKCKEEFQKKYTADQRRGDEHD